MNKDNDPKKTACRKAHQQRRLPANAACIGCGEKFPNALDLHHVMGRAHKRDLTGILCKNCHLKVTEGQLREGATLQPVSGFLELILAQFENLAAFFRSLAEAFDWLVQRLKDFILSLDAQLPNWRESLDEGA